MSNPTIGTIKNLFGKRVKFWFKDLSGRYESTGVVTSYIVAENCLTVKDDKDRVHYYIGIDQVEIFKEQKMSEEKIMIDIEKLVRLRNLILTAIDITLDDMRNLKLETSSHSYRLGMLHCQKDFKDKLNALIEMG